MVATLTRRDALREQIEAIRSNGVSMRWPAGQFERFTPSVADSLVGTTTEMNAREFGYDGTWRMKIVAAEVVEDGTAIDVRLVPDE